MPYLLESLAILGEGPFFGPQRLASGEGRRMPPLLSTTGELEIEVVLALCKTITDSVR